MQCSNPVRIQIQTKTGYASYRYPDGLLVPCGKCLLCRISKRKEWTIRMLHELEEHNDSSFVTLTYSDEFLPDNSSLVVSDLQKFFKRLRKRMLPKKIKYFACGEYGDLSARPHYHCILFGVGLTMVHKKLVMDSWPYCDWNNKTIAKNSFGLAEPHSIRYVAQYIDKKFSGDKAHEEYTLKSRSPVFRLLSNGIGANYCDRNNLDFISKGFISLNGVKHSIPRYYLKRLELTSDLLSLDNVYIKECDVIHHYTGLDYSYDEAYKYLRADEVLKYEEAIKNAKAQVNANVTAKTSLKKSKL